MSEALLDARGVHAWYGSSHVLHGIDLTIGAGETVGLLGRNGMGKTTLIRALLGHVRSREGTVAVAGHDVSRAEPHEIARRGIGYVPEGRGVFPNLTVRENLVATSANRRNISGPWTLDKIFALFPNLKDRKSNLGNQLSGGEQQMLAIGRALMTNPRLLILDEATEGLAPLVRAEIYSSIERLKAAGMAILLIDKDVRSLSRIADRHYVLEKGRVVWMGSSEELSASPDIQHRYLGV